MGAGAVTMKTLAHELGVSITTVSNAYSKPDRLSSELRDQIFAKAKDLGYCGPSAAGRALRSGKTNICGFVFGGQLSAAFSDPFTVQFLSGLSEALEDYDASVLLLRVDHDDELPHLDAPGLRTAGRARRPGGQHAAGRQHRLGRHRRSRGGPAARTPPGQARPPPDHGTRPRPAGRRTRRE